MTLSTAASAALGFIFVAASSDAANVIAIVGDQITDVLCVRSCLRTGVRDRATKSNIVADELWTTGVLQYIIDIGLSNA